jgi:hypothetical protein
MSCCCVLYIYFASFESSPSGEADKTGSSKKISYIHRLTDKYMGPHVRGGGGPGALYIHWLTDEYMSPCVRPPPPPPAPPHIFIGDVAPTNVAPYIHRCYTTDKYNLNSSVPMNNLGYVIGDTFVSVFIG